MLVGDDGGDDDAALDDLLVVGVDVEEGEAGSQNPEGHRADHGSDHAADAAGERSAADHRGGDCVELEADPDSGLSADSERDVARQRRGGGPVPPPRRFRSTDLDLARLGLFGLRQR